jgi:hypothetical protein
MTSPEITAERRRLDAEAIGWTEVRNLVEISYELVAPRSLLKKIKSGEAK